MDLWMHEVLRQRRAEGELALILSFKKSALVLQTNLKTSRAKKRQFISCLVIVFK